MRSAFVSAGYALRGVEIVWEVGWKVGRIISAERRVGDDFFSRSARGESSLLAFSKRTDVAHARRAENLPQNPEEINARLIVFAT